MNQILLVIFYLLLAILTGISLTYPNQKILKYISITGMFVLASMIYFTLDNYKGWPTSDTPHRGAKIASIEIREPVDSVKGMIFIWIYEKGNNDSFFYVPFGDTPKAFIVDYTEESSKAFAKAKEKLYNGYQLFLDDGLEKPHPENSEGKETLPYEQGKPNIIMVNPQKLLVK